VAQPLVLVALALASLLRSAIVFEVVQCRELTSCSSPIEHPADEEERENHERTLPQARVVRNGQQETHAAALLPRRRPLRVRF